MLESILKENIFYRLKNKEKMYLIIDILCELTTLTCSEMTISLLIEVIFFCIRVLAMHHWSDEAFWWRFFSSHRKYFNLTHAAPFFPWDSHTLRSPHGIDRLQRTGCEFSRIYVTFIWQLLSKSRSITRRDEIAYSCNERQH